MATGITLGEMPENNDQLSQAMRTLKQAIETFDDSLFSQLLNKDHVDSGEVLMILYASVVCFNAESAFDILLRRDNYFASKPAWHLLFSQKRVFPRL